MNAGRDGLGILGAEDVRRFENALAGFVAGSGARCALFIDRSGRLLASRGRTDDVDETTFASLASAGFAASGQLAQLLGEREFAALYHHGTQRSMFVADVGGTAILAVLFDTRTTLGMVRINTKALVPVLAEQIRSMAEHGPTGDVVHMESDWASQAESEIDRLFTD